MVIPGCKKMDKKANAMIPGSTWEITSIEHNGVEVLANYFQDSCLCKKLYFSKEPSSNYPNENTVYFSDCSASAGINGYFSSVSNYSIVSEKKAKPRKYAFLTFFNYEGSISSCTCGRYSSNQYFTINDIDTKNQTWQMTADLADGSWVIKFKKVE
jgi:hypothetical protein